MNKLFGDIVLATVTLLCASAAAGAQLLMLIGGG